MSLRFPPQVERRPALVTGASSGIGRATAVALAEAGHPVVVGARRADKLTELVEQIVSSGGQATACPVDVTDGDSVAEFLARATAAYGDPEVLVSSAGSLTMGRVWEMDPEVFAAQIDIHLLSVQRLLHAVLPGMIERRRGDVVLIGSDVAYTNRPRSGAYVAAKAGLEQMAKQVRRELEGTGVRCGVVRPGPVMTEMGTESDPETAESIINDWVRHGFGRHPRMCKPADLARGVMAMVSMPRGAQCIELEIQPEATIQEDYR